MIIKTVDVDNIRAVISNLRGTVAYQTYTVRPLIKQVKWDCDTQTNQNSSECQFVKDFKISNVIKGIGFKSFETLILKNN